MRKNLPQLFCGVTLRLFLLGVFLVVAAQVSADPKINTAQTAQAPKSRITGRVVDDQGASVIGATVVIKGSSGGAITDQNGTFTLEAAPSDVLEVAYLGYQTQSIPVGDRRALDIVLAPLASEMDTVTVVAYGTQRRESVVGAISTVSTKQLNISTGQLSTNLAGKLPGIVVMQRSGEPGSSADFWIRGMSSFEGEGRSSRPLVLVDGVERSMDLVDTEDIETFSILKDASATALYGVRGANGIVIITTKRGGESAPKINIKTEFGMTQPVKLPKMANTEQWLDYYQGLFKGTASEMPEYDLQMYLSGADPDLYPSVDWTKAIFKNMAKTGRVNVNVNGGNKTVRYYTAASYYTEGGIFNMVKTDAYNAQMNFEKFNFRANVDMNVTPSTELGLSLSAQYTTRNMPGHSASANVDDILNWTMLTTPIATPTVFSDGTLAVPSLGYNPYNMLNHTGYRRTTNIVAQSLMSITQDFSDFVTPGLKASVKFAWDSDNEVSMRRNMRRIAYYADPVAGRDEDGKLTYIPVSDGNDYITLDQYNSGRSSWTSINLEAMLNYERQFADAHRVGGMLLYSLRNRTNNVVVTDGSESPYILSLPYKNTGLAGRLTYSYKDTYFFETNFGYNGSENFAPGNRFGFFPSVAVGYMISNENFMESIRGTLNYLKVRASHGKIGNDQIGGSRRFAYNTTINMDAPGFNFGSSYASVGGIATAQFGNPNVAWEEATKTDVGLEFGLFSMLRFQMDYFYELREGIYIGRQSTPSVVGENVQQWVNLGQMQNQGVDMSLEFDKRINNDLFISARGNFTYNRNRNLYDDAPTPVWPYQSRAGFVYNQNRGLIAEGLFSSEQEIEQWPRQTFNPVQPGDIKYRDINGDGLVDQFDVVSIGYSAVPEINYGFGASVVWKDFDFSVFFTGVGHVTRIIGGANLWGQSSNIIRTGQIYADVAKNRWTEDNPNPNAPYPRLQTDKNSNNEQASTYWLRDMSFLRLKNAEIGYTIPQHITKKAGISTLRVYVQGVNLLTFSKFKLWDPELEANYGNRYPTMRTATIGLNINF